MTRAIAANINKVGFAKRSSTLDTQWCKSSKTTLVCFQMSSKPSPSTACLNNLFSDLNVTRINRKRGWGSYGSSRKRSSCLVSLVKECAKQESELGSSTSMPVCTTGPINCMSTPPDEAVTVRPRKERRSSSCSVARGFFGDPFDGDGEPVEF